MTNVVHVNDNNFEAEVLQSKVPVLVDFSASWCGPCQRLFPIVEKFANDNSNIKVCKVDVDDAPNIATSLKIRSVPTLMVFSDGKTLGTKVGLMSLAEMGSFVMSKIAG